MCTCMLAHVIMSADVREQLRAIARGGRNSNLRVCCHKCIIMHSKAMPGAVCVLMLPEASTVLRKGQPRFEAGWSRIQESGRK